MNTQNGIYGYRDKEKNQIVYIGQSNDIYRRHAQHMNPSKYNEQVINRILQNNEDRYELVVIKARSTFSKEDRDILEKHYIEFYNTFSDRSKFNYTPGGDFNPSTLPDIAKKMSEAKRGENHPFYGKHHSEETKRKISKANTGSNHPMYGKKHKEETLEKMRNAKIGSNHPMFGKHHSIEACRNMSLSHNSTGYLRVSLVNCCDCKFGKKYRYRYTNNEGKRTSIDSVSLEKLEQKVLEKGLPWEKFN